MTATPRAVELVETAALAAADKLADGIIAYDVSEQLVITDAFVLCSASIYSTQVLADRFSEIEADAPGRRTDRPRG